MSATRSSREGRKRLPVISTSASPSYQLEKLLSLQNICGRARCRAGKKRPSESWREAEIKIKLTSHGQMWQQDVTLTDDGNKLWENSCETAGNTGRKKTAAQSLWQAQRVHKNCTKAQDRQAEINIGSINMNIQDDSALLTWINTNIQLLQQGNKAIRMASGSRAYRLTSQSHFDQQWELLITASFIFLLTTK